MIRRNVHGVKIQLDGSRMLIHFPRGPITPEQAAEIKAEISDLSQLQQDAIAQEQAQ